MEGRQELLARGTAVAAPAGTGQISAPASGQTITLWASSPGGDQQLAGTKPSGVRWKRIIVNIYASHASAASGLDFQESVDGVTFRTNTAYSISATTYTKNIVSMSAPFLRVRYTNSANPLTTWEMSVIGDEYDRASQ